MYAQEGLHHRIPTLATELRFFLSPPSLLSFQCTLAPRRRLRTSETALTVTRLRLGMRDAMLHTVIY